MLKEKEVISKEAGEGTANRHKVKVLFPVTRDGGKDVSADGKKEKETESDAAKDVRFGSKVKDRAGRAEMLFSTRRRIYLFFISLMTVFTVAGLCLYFRQDDKTAIAYNAFVPYEKETGLLNAFSACYREALFSIVMFASGLTAFAPFVCAGCLSYHFLRLGFYSAVFFGRCVSSEHPFAVTASYFFLTSVSAFSLMLYAAEVWKFSQISSEGVSRALRRENFIPYLINLLIYTAAALSVSYFLMMVF